MDAGLWSIRREAIFRALSNTDLRLFLAKVRVASSSTGTETLAGGTRETVPVADGPPTELRPAAAATKAAKKTQALLREARSLFALLTRSWLQQEGSMIPQPTSFAAEASEAVERVAEHVVRLERQRQRRAKEGPRSRERADSP
jgi:hypothetical protein